jgi:hypothetical protein
LTLAPFPSMIRVSGVTYLDGTQGVAGFREDVQPHPLLYIDEVGTGRNASFPYCPAQVTAIIDREPFHRLGGEGREQ